MKKFLWMLGALLLPAFLLAQTANTVLEGLVTEDATGEQLIGASVRILKKKQLVQLVVTNYEGRFRVALEPGQYDLQITYSGFLPLEITHVNVLAGKINKIDCALSSGMTLQEVTIAAYKVPLISQDKTSSGYTLASDNITGKKGRKNKRAKPPKTPKQKIPKNTLLAGRDTSHMDYQRENYSLIVENSFLESISNPVSTFSIDVDGAAYSNVRRYLNIGNKPPKDAVRVEEFVNYFDYDYAGPGDKTPFAIHVEHDTCPWAPEHRLLVIGLQGKKMELESLPPSNFVFLVDVSGSMSDPNKLPLVQSSLNLLVEQLRPQDRVALVVYAGAAGLVLPSTPGTEKETIRNAIQRLQAGGSTAGAEGIELAYQTAQENFMKKGNNRVILCTDGDFNVGISDESELVRFIEKKRESSVFLSVLGFGTGNYQDSKMQQLADAGDGNHAYIDKLSEAQKVLVEEMGGNLFAIAKDVKIQIEFNPNQVAAYRLIGYENRMLKREDFDNDAKDAGELGAGHCTTALYELIPVGQEIPEQSVTEPLRYQKTKLSAQAKNDELMLLKVRYKKPRFGATSKLIKMTVPTYTSPFVSNNFQMAAAAASFGMLLRSSEYKGNATFDTALELARSAATRDPLGYRKELCGLIAKAKKIYTD